MSGLVVATDLDMSLGDVLVGDGLETTALLTAPSPPPSHSGGDILTPRFYVPDNPCSVVRDLGNRCAVEVALKAAALECGLAVVGATGIDGAGKTCALRALDRDRDVAARFAGGLYNLSFGQDADPSNFVRQLASIVLVSGGVNRAADVPQLWPRKRHRPGLRRTRFFTCDDLREADTRKTGCFPDLSLLDNSHKPSHPQQASCLLFSTRNHDVGVLAPLSGRINFSARDPIGQAAVAMLSTHAEQRVDDL